MADANLPRPLALPSLAVDTIEEPFAGDLLGRRELATRLTVTSTG